MTGRRRQVWWLALVVGLPALHLAVHSVLGVGERAQLIWTDSLLLGAAAAAIAACLRTALRSHEPHLRVAWAAITVGTTLWGIGGAIWSFRELALNEVAPAPSLLDVPFFALAPSFAIALIYFRRRRPSYALHVSQVADLGILTATITIVGTLVLAEPLRDHGLTPYTIVAIGYPGFFLGVVLFALQMLGGSQWGRRRIVLGILVWAHLAFAVVDLLYGAQVLGGEYQTSGLVDTVWLIGFLSLSWAAAEERALRDVPEESPEREASWSAIVGAVAVVALTALSADAIQRLDGIEWTIIVIAAVTAAGFMGLRMWASGRLEEAYQGALAEGEQQARALDLECTRTTRLRAVGSMATGTAHEVSNLIQAIAGNIALARRHAARREPIELYIASIERAVERLVAEVHQLRRLAPSDGGRGTVLMLLEDDPDGRLSAALVRAGYAPALLPDVDSVMRAIKGGNVRAIIAAPREAAELQLRHVTVPIIDVIDDAEQVVRELGSLAG
ncbi:MAG: hypothetical protein JWP01_365 [Myxococcales bacterium]|nr:hypothetical protein [Myxococcales bacterium]